MSVVEVNIINVQIKSTVLHRCIDPTVVVLEKISYIVPLVNTTLLRCITFFSDTT